MVANPVNRRIATALAGPNFTPVDILNIGLDNWFKDPFPTDGSNPLAAANGIMVWIPPEYWSLNPQNTEAANVPDGWVTAAVRLVLNGGAADSFVRIGAISDAMLAAYGVGGLVSVNSLPNALAARAPIFKVPANQPFEDTFFVPPLHTLACQVLTGGLAAPAAGIAPFEAHHILGV